MKTRLLIVLLLSIAGTQAFAGELIYQGKVKGMVCAFCVYSVSKSIGKLPGVNPDTVSVDLKSGQVIFHSDRQQSFKNVAAVFKGSGFKLLSLEKMSGQKHKMMLYKKKPAVIFALSKPDISPYAGIIESLGENAAKQGMKIVITAPAALEEKILRPMIGGKRISLRVRYIFSENKGMKIELFQTQ